MAGFVNESSRMSRVMLLGLAAMVAATGYLGWRLTRPAPTAVPVSQEAAPAPAPSPDPSSPPQGAAPLSGGRAAG